MEFYEVKISDISLTNVGFAVFLRPKDSDDKRVVPIFIGPLETHSITTVIDGTKPPRPMTHDLMLYMLTSLGATVLKITIEEIIDVPFTQRSNSKKRKRSSLLMQDLLIPLPLLYAPMLRYLSLSLC
ncbi:bifunctional nuclease domain protein [Leptospira wolbachii serovar Codice str. CDC]|uniref:Bifunctional nuclease domain protein n=1 Tax=Leptospira wolbachii serovar Codice str. CDC TaxID=1218599 RepID=R9A6T4_9LEPT|nr:bifunctional nuclease domain protein [Leptospira wolbachii serovar Codice str. CDC]